MVYPGAEESLGAVAQTTPGGGRLIRPIHACPRTPDLRRAFHTPIPCARLQAARAGPRLEEASRDTLSQPLAGRRPVKRSRRSELGPNREISTAR